MNADHALRPIPTAFTRDGYDFRQLWRQGHVAIYSQQRPWATEPAAWEVVAIRPRKAHPKDVDQNPKEGYPGDAEWGMRGWTLLSLESAQKKALEVLAR